MAGFTATAKNAALTTVSGNAAYVSLHTGDPGSNGANEVAGGSYARVQTTWGAVSAASVAGSQVTINVPAATTITYWGIWTAVSAGTFYEGGALQNSEAYTGAGTYALTITLSASG